jgi:hypothetical protein
VYEWMDIALQPLRRCPTTMEPGGIRVNNQMSITKQKPKKTISPSPKEFLAGQKISGASDNTGNHRDNIFLRYVHKSQQKWLWELANALIKGTAFYFAITAALIGYALSKNLSIQLQRLVLISGIVISVLFLIAAGACIWGMFRSIASVKRTFKLLSSGVIEDDELQGYFSAAKKVLWIAVICSGIVFTIFIIGMAALLFQPVV